MTYRETTLGQLTLAGIAHHEVDDDVSGLPALVIHAEDGLEVVLFFTDDGDLFDIASRLTPQEGL